MPGLKDRIHGNMIKVFIMTIKLVRNNKGDIFFLIPENGKNPFRTYSLENVLNCLKVAENDGDVPPLYEDWWKAIKLSGFKVC